MEEQMKKDWQFIKGVLLNSNHYTDKHIDKFEQQMKRVVREKKLKRIFNI